MRPLLNVINDRVFHLANDTVSYILYLLPNNQLGHLYYGPRVTVDEATLAAYTTLESKSGGTVHFDATNTMFTLADQLQEYPVYGTSDFRQGAIAAADGDTPLYLNFTYVGYRESHEKPRDLAFPKSFASDGEVDVLTITLEDAAHGLTLEQHYAIFEDAAAIVRWQTVTNTGTTAVTLTRALSGGLDLPTADYRFVQLSGNWARERHVKTRKLAQGTTAIESQRGASSHQQNPYVALQAEGGTLTTGAAYGFNLIYSGNFQASAEVNEWNQTRFMIGIHPDQFAWRLDPTASFTTPEAVVTYSGAGLSGLSAANADFVRNHVIAPEWRNRKRPVVLNSWEAAYFDFDTEKLLKLAAAGKKVGIDCFVLDDGWFGHRDDDRSSLGDWQVYDKKFPHGIDGFAESIHKLGLQFGLWFEPEMISPRSNLIAAHPDWVVAPPHERRAIGRNQYVLDFANPDVVDNLFAQMTKVIDATHLEYIKWDMNRNITEAYSQYLARICRPQGEFFHRYIGGVYNLYARLLAAYPDLLIEGCAGGGGRFDLGILFYSPQIWVSDDSDAVERLRIQTGTALGYPLSAMSNHVTAVPNGQVQRTTPLDTRFNVALFGTLGYELDLTKEPQAVLDAIAQQITTYKALQPLVLTGRFHFLRTLEDPGHNTVAWALEAADQSRIVFGFYRLLANPDGNAVDRIAIPFADPAARYTISGREGTVTGSALRHLGLRLPYEFNGPNQAVAELAGDFQSKLLILTKED
ncbi:alpha-galactosidase [Lacticaseibacillus kribbianus]|uniref:alpha-galactosidase n=1 Tax=Lacticaseibacillus kribbianus TaxID=2926292 RepID=UPI001CD25C1E|nr:alpha-galactosidase [Lacticaseibacillus kribbianus]